MDVESGTLNLANGGELQGDAVVAGGAQLFITGGAFTGSSFNVTGGGTSEFTGGNATFTGAVSLVNLSVTGGTLTIATEPSST